jgi:hypothetical protein
MNLPDQENNDKFATISEDFNKSAMNFANGTGLSYEGLMAKYDILSKFKAESPVDQTRLTQGLFDGGMQILTRVSDMSFRESLDSHASSFRQMFEFLTTPAQMPYLPDNASDRLVEAALNLIKKSEGMNYSYGWSDFAAHKSRLIDMAKSVSTFAEKTREPKPQVATFAITKTIPPAKKLTLSNDNGM